LRHVGYRMPFDFFLSDFFFGAPMGKNVPRSICLVPQNMPGR
jgi:hypothetical protein